MDFITTVGRLLNRFAAVERDIARMKPHLLTLTPLAQEAEGAEDDID